MITVYSKPACVQCTATYRSLDNKNIEYKSINISEDSEALEYILSLGHQSAPVVVKHVDGKLVDSWAGFRPDKIESIEV